MGGIALAAWSHPRATRDVDVLIGIELTKIEPVLAQLAAHGCRPKRSPPMLAVGEHALVQLLYTPPDEFYDVQFDLMLATTPLEKSAIERRVPRAVPGIEDPIDVLNCDDLILFKLVSGRLIDRADAAMLVRENLNSIDLAYLGRWLVKLGLSSDFAEIWQEAFPSDVLPPQLSPSC
jgi:hypothetical protein